MANGISFCGDLKLFSPLVRRAFGKRVDLPGKELEILAVLKLRQELGRLVRTPTDRGVILTADSWLASRPYRLAFLSSTPVAPKIIHAPEELEVVLREVFR